MSLPWQLRLSTIFDALMPAEVQRREPYWREGDFGVHDDTGNNVLRFRDYSSDGHEYRQEAVLSAGTAVGTVMRGNDRVGDLTSHITFADVIVNVAQAMNFKVPQDKLLWNSTPFNPKLNPTFGMPPGLAAAEDAFEIVAGLAGLGSLDDTLSVQSDIQDLAGNGFESVIGFADFSSPFEAYCTLLPQKLPMMNFAWFMFLELLIQGAPLFLSSAPGTPIIPSPLLKLVAKTAKMNATTAFKGSIEGKVIGDQLRQTLLAGVPGIGAAFA